MKTFELNNKQTIPAVGFGVFMIPNDGPTYDATLAALKAGYRHIDTAAGYCNESDVGKAIKDSGIDRSEIFITSKLWLQDYGYENAKKGIETSMKLLGVDYIDLYLLHQPYGDYLGAWKALEEAYQAGKIKSIGISNITVNLWNKFKDGMTVMPAVNQVEFNPFVQQKELRKVMAENNIRLEAWYPLGHGNKDLLENETIVSLAKKYHKNAGQIILRWIYQEGVISLPKSTNEERMKGNIDIFDFELTDEEMKAMQALDTNKPSHNPEDPANETRYDLQDMFGAGKVAMMIGPNNIPTYLSDGGYDINYDVTTIPANEGCESVAMGVCDRLEVFKDDSAEDQEARTAAISKFFDFFYDDERYADYMVYEGFLPTTQTAADLLAKDDETYSSWIDILQSCNFYPATKTEWADVKQGVINVEQNALLGGDVQELLDDLQAEIAG